jgi:hypothetical protein
MKIDLRTDLREDDDGLGWALLSGAVASGHLGEISSAGKPPTAENTFQGPLPKQITRAGAGL